MDGINIIEKIKVLPQNPGVYIFRDAKRKIIYIGKATDLRGRVGSYFRNYKGSDRPIETMIHQVADIEMQETESVFDALILEANLIQKHQPKYNVLGKDDKSFSYFVITKEEFPRVLILRKTEVGKDTKNKIQITNKSPITNHKIKFIFGPYISKKQMEIALKIIRRIFPFHSSRQKTERGCLDFQLGRCPGPYAGVISKADYAKNIRGIKMILGGKRKSLLKKLEKEMQVLAEKNEFEKAAEARNKIFALKHIQDVAFISREDEKQIPNLNSRINYNDQNSKSKNFRIEAYDISNISGQQAVGSMVVFVNSQPQKKEYRKFKIKTVTGANDVAMMKEVLWRRFNNDWTQPDLILLDGGQGHLNMAQKILNDLGFVITLVAVAKGPDRKNIKLQIKNYKKIKNSKLQKHLDEVIEDKNLIKYIMDEAHRFAISYHRKLRKKEFI